MSWLAQWKYRKQFSISRSAGSISNYQIKLIITTEDLNYHCLESFNDLRFTNESSDVLNYWIESITGSSPDLTALVWVKFDYIGISETNFYLYYGNNSATSFTNGNNTFEYFLDKDSTSGWTGSESIVLSVSGDFLDFYYGSSGYTYKQKYMSSLYQKRSTYICMKNVDISNNEIDIGFKNNTLDCGIITIGKVSGGDQLHWYTNSYDSELEGGSWTEGTEYKFKLLFDDTTSSGAIYQYDLSDQLLSSVTNLTFVHPDWLPATSSGFSMSSDYPFNFYLKYLYTTELLNFEPVVGYFGEEELPFIGLAADDDYRDGDTKINKVYLGTSIIYIRQSRCTIATGGNISYYGDYTIHTFLSSGDFIVTYKGDDQIEYLIVAGGGGGGTAPGGTGYTCGGGGAGGVLTGSFDSLDINTYPVVVGAGGGFGLNGANSTFNSLIAYGGGRGGEVATNKYVGGNGGCGGGGVSSRRYNYAGGSGSQGFNGGAGIYSSFAAHSGGGGGMGVAGQDGVVPAANGGNGIICSITGSSVYYGGGGAGCMVRNMSYGWGTGGLGGGGGSGSLNGAANTGGGGAGGLRDAYPRNGGVGGSGIVIIRYKNK